MWRKVASPIKLGLLQRQRVRQHQRQGGARQYFISCVKSPYFICRFYELIATQIPDLHLRLVSQFCAPLTQWVGIFSEEHLFSMNFHKRKSNYKNKGTLFIIVIRGYSTY